MHIKMASLNHLLQITTYLVCLENFGEFWESESSYTERENISFYVVSRDMQNLHHRKPKNI